MKERLNKRDMRFAYFIQNVFTYFQSFSTFCDFEIKQCEWKGK